MSDLLKLTRLEAVNSVLFLLSNGGGCGLLKRGGREERCGRARAGASSLVIEPI